MTAGSLHQIVGLDKRGEDALSHFRDCDQSNVLPSSPETGIGTIPGGRVSSSDFGSPTFISFDQSRLTNPIGGFDLFMVKCSAPEQSVQCDDQG